MKQPVMLTIAFPALDPLLHASLRGRHRPGDGAGKLRSLIAVPISVVWLYGTLVLAERRSGYIITLLLGLLSFVVPIVHMKGKGVGVASSLVNSSGHFFFVWTLIAIGVTGLFSVILSVHGLWRLHGAGPGSHNPKWRGPLHRIGQSKRMTSRVKLGALPGSTLKIVAIDFWQCVRRFSSASRPTCV